MSRHAIPRAPKLQHPILALTDKEGQYAIIWHVKLLLIYVWDG